MIPIQSIMILILIQYHGKTFKNGRCNVLFSFFLMAHPSGSLLQQLHYFQLLS